MSTPRQRAIRVAVVAAGAVAALAAAELAVRVLLEPPDGPRFVPQAGRGIETEGVPDQGFYRATPAGTRLKANVRGVVRGHYLTGADVPLRTNEYGFRGPPVVVDRRPRVLFLGDSITLGDYLAEEDTFVHRVGALSEGTAMPLQTINAGVGSIGTEDELDILRRTGPRIAPDVVVLDLYLNDALASPVVHPVAVPRALRWSRLAGHLWRAASASRSGDDDRRVPRAVVEGWWAETLRRYPPGPGDWRRDRGAFNRMMLDWFVDWGSAYSEGGQERILRFARQIVEVSESLGARPLVVIHPNQLQVEAEFDPDQPQRAFVDAFERDGVPVLDLLPILRTRWAADPRPVFYDHCHHNPEGAALVAGEVYAFIVRSIESPDGEAGD